MFFTRPHLADYMTDAAEIRSRVDDLFSRWSDGTLRVSIDQMLSLSDAADAHRIIEGRGTTGKLLLAT